MANPHPIQRPVEEKLFHQRDALKAGAQGALVGGGAGLVLSAVQNSLAKQNVGAWGVFTRTGGTIASLATLTTVYSFSKVAAGNLREKDDAFNTTIGSFLGGAALALKSGSTPRILGYGAGFAVIMTAFDYSGGSLRGTRTEVPGMDEYERKEHLRLNRRRPIEETIADLGESRGIKPPGYEERRRERLKEKYGVEIKPVSALAE
ncbi:putative NADH:ubiquinone oxidoreductase subunit [Rosellinia necatrix]|uniref:Putative NADH:ubiquinone oxidoreductase subunit n=1 Tax=Rosellinia necatrix TaxID=77044 RepID=A0A1S7UP27_ROSNE|nr:putative NADH:ubiquinone oxidoreductase subunit [Rosellinia necatrix]